MFYLHTEHILFHEIKYVLYVHSFSIRTEHLGFPGGAAGAMEERVLLSIQNSLALLSLSLSLSTHTHTHTLAVARQSHWEEREGERQSRACT